MATLDSSASPLSSDPLLRLEACETPAQWRAFERAAEFLYEDQPDFVPPLPGSIVRHLNPRGHFQNCHGPIRAWLALRGSRIIGRLAAIVNRSHNLYHGDRVGFFGYPALTKDPVEASAAFQALLREASEWLASQGCEAVRGPYNPSINEECGLLIEGTGGPSTVGMTWNPLGTEAYFLGAGLRRIRESVALVLDLTLGEPERIRRVRERIARRNALTLRHLNLRSLPTDLQRLQQLYNCTLDRNWGFVPMRYDDWLESASEFRRVADPRLILLAESRGRPAAFAMSLPNVHEILYACRRVPYFLRWPFLAWKTLTHRYEGSRLAVLGVAPEFRDRGLTGWLCGETQIRTSSRFRWCEISWVEANNAEIIANAELMGGVPHRRYGIYEMALGVETRLK